MRTIGRLLLAIALGAGAGALANEEGAVKSDEATIIALHQEFSAAWSKADFARMMTFYDEDAVRVGAMGDRQRGHAELRAAFEKLLGGPFKGARVTTHDDEVRVLSPELAVWRAQMTIEPGAGKPPLRGHVVDVMKKVKGRWLILESHPKLFPPPPPSGS